jgi:hypothetical protein
MKLQAYQGRETQLRVQFIAAHFQVSSKLYIWPLCSIKKRGPTCNQLSICRGQRAQNLKSREREGRTYGRPL